MFKSLMSRAPIAVAGLSLLPMLTLASSVTPVTAVPNTVNGRGWTNAAAPCPASSS